MGELNAVRVLIVEGKPLCLVADDFEPPMMANSEIVEFRRVQGAAMKRGKSAQDVRTPRVFLDAVEARFGEINFDLAATEGADVTQQGYYFGPDRCGGDSDFCDSLKVDWEKHSYGNRWLNPPFDPIPPWVRKCAETAPNLSASGAIFLLCPLAVGTKWFRTFVAPFADVHNVGRITFVGATDPFPKDLALCIYRREPPEHPGMIHHWEWAPKKVRGKKGASEGAVELPVLDSEAAE